MMHKREDNQEIFHDKNHGEFGGNGPNKQMDRNCLVLQIYHVIMFPSDTKSGSKFTNSRRKLH